MNIKWLYAIVAGLGVIIFAGNLWVVTGCSTPSGECQCAVTVVKDGPSRASNPNPSCSVKMSISPLFFASPIGACEIVEPGTFDRVIMCDSGMKAKLDCHGGQKLVVGSGTSSVLSCEKEGDNLGTVKASHNTSWFNNTGNGKSSNAGGNLRLVRKLVERILDGTSTPTSRFLTETELVTLVNGEVGIEQNDDGSYRVMLTSGQATVQGLCAGTSTSLTAPAILTVVNDLRPFAAYSGQPLDPSFVPCDLSNVNGVWHGGFSGQNGAVTATITVNGNSGNVQTSDGNFDITQIDANSYGSIHIRANDHSGGQAYIDLTGTYNKGTMTFQAIEAAMGSDASTENWGQGGADRLYIADWLVPNAGINANYQYQLTAISPNPGDIAWQISSGALPPGLSLDPAAGLLSGTPTSTGNYKFAVQATDSAGDTFQQPVTMSVQNMVLITNMLPDALPGQSYQYTLQVAGGQPPYTFTNLLPLNLPGLPQLASDGTVTLTPAQSGQVPVMFTVRDSARNSQIMVVAINVRSLTILDSVFLPPATVGAPYDYTFQTSAPEGAVTWSIQEDLTGSDLQFNTQNGELSGTPTAANTSYINITAKDSASKQARMFVLTVDDVPAPAASQARTNAKAARLSKTGTSSGFQYRSGLR